MTPLQANVKDIFEQAIEIESPDQRKAFLDEALAASPDARWEVEELLEAYAQAGSFLDPALPPTGPGGPTNLSVESGTIIAGRYKLLQKIGEGGMGTVFMAEQTQPVKRRVAVKLIHADRVNSKTILARFEAERQAIAMMDHPHIARLLEAGTTDTGSPFFVMELVKGVSLTEFCDTHKLSIPDRLNLFMQICSAVQHAHQKGIIHRDLKPSNILVESHDGKPVPKVIDFGVAKATSGMQLSEQTLFTGFGSVIGTPLYMAPEQATFNAVDVDTRADLYALGVILYELLTGSTPITREAIKKMVIDEILRLIRDQEAPTPSSRLSSSESKPSIAANRQSEPLKLGRFLKGELDWIVMKALSKERDRRYETANGFARDVERFLNHEPVSAGPPTVRYRTRKFLRRHRGPVLAGALVALALLGGVFGTSWGLVKAKREQRETANERDQKDLALKSETAARTLTMNVLRKLTDEVVERLLSRRNVLTPDDRKFLRDIQKQYEEFASLPGDEEEQRAIRAEGYSRIGSLLRLLGEEKDAETAYRQAISLYGSLATDFPARTEFRHDLARVKLNLGVLLHITTRLKEAEEVQMEGIALLTALVAEDKSQHTFLKSLASGQINLGKLYFSTGRPKEAEPAFRDAISIARSLIEQFPERADFLYELAGSQVHLGILLKDTDRPDDAEIAYKEAIANFHALSSRHPNQSEYKHELAASYNNLGLLHGEHGQLEKAHEAYSKAQLIFKQLAADFPTRPAFRHDLAASYHNLGDLLSDLKKPKDAETAYLDALTIYKQLVDGFPTRAEFRLNLGRAHNSHGILLAETNRTKEAEAAYSEAISIYQKLVNDHPSVPDYANNLAGSLGNLAGRANRRGDFASARRLLEQALSHHQTAIKAIPKHPGYRQFYHNNLIELTQARAGVGDHVAAGAAATLLHDLGGDPPADAYDAACALALCVRIMEKEQKAGPQAIAKAVQFYTERAMAMLADAILKGFDDVMQIKNDTDLDPLRDREDFKKLLSDLEKKSPPPKKPSAPPGK